MRACAVCACGSRGVCVVRACVRARAQCSACAWCVGVCSVCVCGVCARVCVVCACVVCVVCGCAVCGCLVCACVVCGCVCVYVCV